MSLRRSLFFSFALLVLISVGLVALGYMRFGLRPVVDNIAESHLSRPVPVSEFDRLVEPDPV